MIVAPDERRVSLVWQTKVPCQGREHRLEHTLVWEKAYV